MEQVDVGDVKKGILRPPRWWERQPAAGLGNLHCGWGLVAGGDFVTRTRAHDNPHLWPVRVGQPVIFPNQYLSTSEFASMIQDFIDSAHVFKSALLLIEEGIDSNQF